MQHFEASIKGVGIYTEDGEDLNNNFFMRYIKITTSMEDFLRLEVWSGQRK